MRGREPKPRTTPLAEWLTAARLARGLSMRSLAEIADISQARISQIEDGGTTKRETIDRLARALTPADLPPEEAENSYQRILSDGLRAGGFAREELPSRIPRRVIEFYENNPPSVTDPITDIIDQVYGLMDREIIPSKSGKG